LNYLVGAGRTDAETPEWAWWAIQPISSSTKEMGPGAWHDTMVDYWGYWNWQKFLVNAHKEHQVQQDVFQTFSKGLEPSSVSTWQGMAEMWEQDQTKPNLYEL
ncbi:hypothetical protein JAAARDRAFT_88395, partial [Jaapia argillacea MUCL 33604]